MGPTSSYATSARLTWGGSEWLSNSAAPEGSAPALSDSAREEIKEKLYTQALEARYARWLKEDLRQKHSVEMLP